MLTQDILRALRSTQIGGAQAAEVLDALSVGFRNYCDPVSYTHLTLPTNREV